MEMTASGSPVSVSLHDSKGPEDGGEVPKNHTNLADNDPSVNEVAPGAVSLWHALPVEVFAVIFDHLVAVVHNDMSITRKKRQRAIKCRISHISLVCWHWCHSFRHFLFQQPCLESPEHIQTLTNILKNPLSSWLRERITSVFFRNRRKGDAMQMPWPQWRTLLQFLPNLSYLRVAGHFGYMRIYAWRDRPVLNGLHSLRSLQLISMRFPSSSGLIRVLGALPHLEGLSLGAVRWPAAEGSPTQLVSCGSGFERIRRAASFGTSEHWPLAWLFAAASTRHRYSMRVDASAIVPPDVLAIVQLSGIAWAKISTFSL
ncbi:uncharacterized protein PHACADRAFT_202762 [Phanerochaete carnosa HHB-10118-sp]|uniref:Uncharacterized protein n=1 Tax=Phanerochaete carnosa (strain HHB-10118-sp) TaxID=650164 RepID=K5VPH5_PHACS|nr:uncharacterized protein PHACADRAFT_202762 [Phanerochaete carnosa HHB-10118-sp]EKM48479.1 hypothetical protein PHACADRAFT_202762 [Phanerochaete carnosa HHB-10118-sp]